MKAILTVSTMSLAIVAVAASVVCWVELRSNRALRTAGQKSEGELRALKEAFDVLRTENQEIAKKLATAQDASRSLQSQIAEIQTAATNDSETATSPPVVAPYQVQAYLGQDYLGPAWIIPRNYRMDPKLKRYVYEPVVWLDESLRNSFVVHQTNVVEREVETAYVNNSYYPQPFYYYVTSPGHHRGRYQFPSGPHPPSKPQAPSPPQSPVGEIQPTPVFNPGSGITTPQRLGTPAGAIRTRPQVLGTPAGAIRTRPQLIGNPGTPP